MVTVPSSIPTLRSMSWKAMACGACTGGEAVGAAAAAASAFAALMRPPVRSRPSKRDVRLTLFKMMFLTCIISSFGRYIHTSAARPLTAGVAMEVPLLRA